MMSATNAASEKSFSAAQRIKTYLHSDVSAASESFYALKIHNDSTDGQNVVDVAWQGFQCWK